MYLVESKHELLPIYLRYEVGVLGADKSLKKPKKDMKIKVVIQNAIFPVPFRGILYLANSTIKIWAFFSELAAEIKIRAERRAGVLLGDMDRREKGETDKKIMLHDVTLSIPKLDELGITKIQSHRWQLEAEAVGALYLGIDSIDRTL